MLKQFRDGFKVLSKWFISLNLYNQAIAAKDKTLKKFRNDFNRTHIITLGVVAIVSCLIGSAFSGPSAANAPVAIDKTLVEVIKTLNLIKPESVDVVYTSTNFPKDLTTESQADLLIYAYNIAKADGFKDPTYLQGLIWQESHAGGYEGHEVAGDEYGLRVGKRYYGIGQIKVNAAKDVFKRFADEFPNFYEKGRKVVLANGKTKWIKGRYLMTHDEIIAYLITDQKFNIRVASKYLWIMQHKERRNKPTFVRPINYAVTAYNRGLGNTYKTEYNTWHYTVAVNKYRTTWIPKFNARNVTHLDIGPVASVITVKNVEK